MIIQNKVAIVGAGIAALSCATALEKSGFCVTLFEKSRSVSGRLSTKVKDDWQCDHGAQYFTARDPLFSDEVERWATANVAKLWQPVLKVFDGNSFLPKKNEKEAKTVRYVGYPRNNSPANWMAQTLHVLTESTVSCIHKHANQWQVNLIERGLYPESFDFLILSIPAPQAATLIHNTETILANLCTKVLMQPCFALILTMNKKINCQFDGLFINTGMLSWVARDSAKPGRKCRLGNNSEVWILHATSQWSKAHLNDEKDIIIQQMLGEFIKILHIDGCFKVSTANELNIESYDLHRWIYADCEQPFICEYQFDAEHNIGLCGDWLNGGKVQGAWLSGLKLANELIDKNKYC